ncbi:MAG: hypothetical protein GY830_11295 [Bacteroidetes bacterium]|nr:hypothetical protein [Bacteroidota bacterium]
MARFSTTKNCFLYQDFFLLLLPGLKKSLSSNSSLWVAHTKDENPKQDPFFWLAVFRAVLRDLMCVFSGVKNTEEPIKQPLKQLAKIMDPI